MKAILFTLCGCQREIEIPETPPGQVTICLMRLPVDCYRLDEIGVPTRTFRLLPTYGAVPIYEEVLGP